MNIKPITSGSIVFNKEDITNLPSFKIAKLGIGLVPEGRQIFPNLTTHENLIATANITEKKKSNLDFGACLRTFSRSEVTG
jgi:ABC-type branched-subunit amino acid transport system ATPase component